MMTQPFGDGGCVPSLFRAEPGQGRGFVKAAVIGIGSNSVRMLIAEKTEKTFLRLGRDREGTRLFAGLDEQGRLSSDSMEHTAAAVRRMAERARSDGAETIHIFATSASRDAKNGAEFEDLIWRETGEKLEILSGEEEAVLSFRGASAVFNGSIPVAWWTLAEEALNW